MFRSDPAMQIVLSHLKHCEICGCEYRSKRSDSKTCSARCRRALSRGGYKNKCDRNDLQSARVGAFCHLDYCLACNQYRDAIKPQGIRGPRPGLCSSCFNDGYQLVCNLDTGDIWLRRRLSWLALYRHPNVTVFDNGKRWYVYFSEAVIYQSKKAGR